MIIFHLQAFRTVIYLDFIPGWPENGGEAMAVWGVWQGDRKMGTLSSGGYLRPCWSSYQFRGWMVNRPVRIRCWVGERGLLACQ